MAQHCCGPTVTAEDHDLVPSTTSASSQPPVTSFSRDLSLFPVLLGHICGVYACTQHPHTQKIK